MNNRLKGQLIRMRNVLVRVSAFMLMAVVCIACSSDTSGIYEEHGNMPGRVIVSGSIFPVYDIARQIGGSKIDVHLILSPGESAHFFNPSVSDKQNVESSGSVFVIGHELDDWASNMVDDKSKIVRLDDGIELIEYSDDDHDSENDHDADDAHDSKHLHGEYDPHYWLDPRNAKIIASTIVNEYKNIDPDESEYYEMQLKIFTDSVDELYSNLTDKLSVVHETPFVTLHDGWGYFAEAFDLNIVGSFEPISAENPTPKYLEDLQNVVKEHGVRVVFSEPQLSTESLKAFALDNNLSIGTLDPLGGSNGIQSYQNLIRYNVETIFAYLSEANSE